MITPLSTLASVTTIQENQIKVSFIHQVSLLQPRLKSSPTLVDSMNSTAVETSPFLICLSR